MRKTTFPAVLTTFLLCFAFWLLLTWSLAVQELAVGAAVSLAVALFSARLFIHERAFWLCHPGRLFTGLFYWVCVFPVELVKANCAMVGYVFGKKIEPGIVKIPVDLHSSYGRAALANSITLTPGTITMDIAEQEGQTWYYVHWIDARCDGAEAGEAIKGRMEKWIRRFWEK